MRKTRHGAAEQTRLIEQYRSSGLSAKAFATREGITPGTFYQWLARTPQGDKPLRLARVIRRRTFGGDTAATVNEGGIVVEVGSVRVRVCAGFDALLFESVLDVLESRAQGGRS